MYPAKGGHDMSAAELAEQLKTLGERDGATDPILPVRDIAIRWGRETATIRSRLFRNRVGLQLVRVGGKAVGAYLSHVIEIEKRG